MRLKDCAKHYMDAGGATLTKGIHPTLAVLSDVRHQAKLSSEDQDFDTVDTTLLHLYHACDTMIDHQIDDNIDNTGLVLEICDSSQDSDKDSDDENSSLSEEDGDEES
eukprot:10251718-Ditylum_brightwellii.AAC.1